MPDYDGSITIETRIDDDGAAKDVSTMAASMRKSLESLDNVSEKTRKSIEKQIDSYEKLGIQLKKQEAQVAKYKAQLEALDNQPIQTDEFKQVEKDINSAEKALLKLYDRREKYEELHTGKTSDSLEYDIRQQEERLKLLEDARQSMIDNDQRYDESANLAKQSELIERLRVAEEQLDMTNRKLTDSYTSINTAMSNAGADMAKVEQEANGTASGVERMKNSFNGLAGTVSTNAKSATKDLKNVNKQVEKIHKSSSKLTKTAWTIAKAIIGVRGLYMLVRKLKAALVEGFSNLAKYNSQLNTNISDVSNSLAQFKNNIAAAFAPIANYVLPLISKLISYLNVAVEAISRFFAYLTGKSSYTRAKKQNKDYAASLDDVGSSAEEATKSLAAFDDLNVLDNSNDSKSGGGGAGGDTGADLFEEVPLEALDLSKWKGLIDELKKLADIFKENFMKGLLDALGDDFFEKLQRIKDNLERIKNVLIDIWTDPEVVAAMERYVASLGYLLGTLVGTVARIAVNLAVGFTEGIADYLENNVQRIKDHIVAMFDIGTEINTILAQFNLAIGKISDAFATDEFASIVENVLGIFLDLEMGLSEIVLKIVRDVALISFQPIIDNAEGLRDHLTYVFGWIGDRLAVVKQVVDDFVDSLNVMYDAHIKPLADKIASGGSKLLSTLLETIEKIHPYIEEFGSILDDMWTSHISPLVSQVIRFIGNLADVMGALYDNVLYPLISFLITDVYPILQVTALFLGEEIVTAIDLVADALTYALDFVNAFIEGILGTSTAFADGMQAFADWAADVYDTIATAISDWDFLQLAKDIVSGFINGLTSTWSELVSEFQTFCDQIIDAVKDVFGIHSPSTVFQTIGENIVQGLILGIQNLITDVVTIFTTLLTSIYTVFETFITTIVTTLETIWLYLQELFNTAVLFLQELFIALVDWFDTTIITPLQTAFSTLTTNISQFFSTAWENIKKVWSLVQGWFKTNIFDPLTEKFTKIKEHIIEAFNTAKEKSTEAMDKLWEGIKTGAKGAVNAALSAVEHMINAIIDGINALLEPIRELAGAVGLDFAIPTLHNVTIPKLAQGAVIPPNKEFMAILGDQKSGTNIEAPLDTIVQAMRTALGSSGYGGDGGNQTITLNIDGETFARLMVPHNLDELNRLGYDVSVLEG